MSFEKNNWPGFLNNIPASLISNKNKKLLGQLMEIAAQELSEPSPMFVYFNEEYSVWHMYYSIEKKGFLEVEIGEQSIELTAFYRLGSNLVDFKVINFSVSNFHACFRIINLLNSISWLSGASCFVVDLDEKNKNKNPSIEWQTESAELIVSWSKKEIIYSGVSDEKNIHGILNKENLVTCISEWGQFLQVTR